MQIRVIGPKLALRGLAGHTWEQAVLPMHTRGELLWSPCGTGPLATRSQVVTIHDVIPIDYPHWYSKQFSALHRMLVPRLARRVRRVIAVSEYTAKRLADLAGIPNEKISIIPNGVGEEFHPRPAQEIAEARQKLGIPSEQYLLTLNSLVPRKNVPGLLRAWEELLPHVPESLWLVVAGGSGSQTVFPGSGRLSAPPRVVFTGYVRDELLPPLYSGALAFAFPSLCEGFGLPVLEAMACGTPVVTSEGSSLAEIGAGAAILVDPASTTSIAGGVREMISNDSLRRALARAGRDRARHYTWARCVEMTRAVLMDELSRRPSPLTSAAEALQRS